MLIGSNQNWGITFQNECKGLCSIPLSCEETQNSRDLQL
jgi:hypothetical protein